MKIYHTEKREAIASFMRSHAKEAAGKCFVRISDHGKQGTDAVEGRCGMGARHRMKPAERLLVGHNGISFTTVWCFFFIIEQNPRFVKGKRSMRCCFLSKKCGFRECVTIHPLTSCKKWRIMEENALYEQKYR